MNIHSYIEALKKGPAGPLDHSLSVSKAQLFQLRVVEFIALLDSTAIQIMGRRIFAVRLDGIGYTIGSNVTTNLRSIDSNCFPSTFLIRDLPRSHSPTIVFCRGFHPLVIKLHVDMLSINHVSYNPPSHRPPAKRDW